MRWICCSRGSRRTHRKNSRHQQNDSCRHSSLTSSSFVVPRRILLPANDANQDRASHELLDSRKHLELECSTSSHRFWSCYPKRHGDVSHSESFVKSSDEFFAFLFALIRVFRGLNLGCGGAALSNPRFRESPGACDWQPPR